MFNTGNFTWSLWASADGNAFTERSVTGAEAGVPLRGAGEGFVTLLAVSGGTVVYDLVNDTQVELTYGVDYPMTSVFYDGAAPVQKFWTGFVACAET